MITINGQVYNGSSLSIVNGVISIDGKNVITPSEKIINISVNGNIDELRVGSCQKVEVSGDVKNLQTTSGDVVCGNVTNSVQTTSGDVECDSVGGNVSTVSGDVKCEEIKGRVSTVSGDIGR